MPQSFPAPMESNAPETTDELLLLDDEPFVRAAYALVLGRPADKSGLLSFLRQVRQGVSKEQILVALATSDEARARGGASPMLASLLTTHAAPRPRCRVCRLIRRLLADALEPLLQQLRAIDNRLYRMEMQAGERLMPAVPAAGHGNPPAPAAPVKPLVRLDDSSTDQVFSTIRAFVRNSPEATVLRQRPDAAAVASHGH